MKEATFQNRKTGRLHTFRLGTEHGWGIRLTRRVSVPRTRYHGYRASDWEYVRTRRIHNEADARQFWDHFMRWMSNRRDMVNLNSGQRT